MVGKKLIDQNKDLIMLTKRKDTLERRSYSRAKGETPEYEISFDESTRYYKLWRWIE